MSRVKMQASEVSTFALPTNLEAGGYELEANYEGISRTMEFTAGQRVDSSDEATLLSFNVNLNPAVRWSFLGHQWLLENNARRQGCCPESSLAAGVTKEAEVELARTEALAGEWDGARDRLRKILAGKSDDFDALSVLAYIETKLQDYSVAAQLYRRALAVRDSAALRMALASLPQAGVAN